MTTWKTGRYYFFAVLGVLVAILWHFLAATYLNRLPTNFSFTADIQSTDNFYDTQSQRYQGEINSNTHFSYTTIAHNGNDLEIQNLFDVRTPAGDKIFSVQRLYAVDRATGQHIPTRGDRSREGYLFAPKNLNKQDFTYWHINYDTPITMRFADEESLLGLPVYRYASDFKADQTKNLGNLPGVGITKGVNLDVHLELWIEPTTGRMVKYQDSAVAYYYDLKTGTRLAPWNKFGNTFTIQSINAQVRAMKKVLNTLFINVWIVPGIFLLLMVLLCFIPLLQSSIGSKRMRLVFPLVLLLVGVIITLVTWQYTKNTARKQLGASFTAQSLELEGSIRDRLSIYVNALRGAKQLFDSSNDVTRSEWKTYIDGIQLLQNYPGIQGMGHAVFIEPKDLQKHIASIRSEGFPDYTVRPDGKRDIYSSIIYIEPFDSRNQKAFGFDMFQEPVRHNAMVEARDSGEVAMSGKVTLVQENNSTPQPGFLIYAPLYKKDVSLKTEDERGAAITGYVYSAFRINDLMKGVAGNRTYDIDYEIYDGKTISESAEMYDSDIGEFSKDESYTPAFSTTKTISLYGHEWTLRFISLPDYASSNQENQVSWFVLVGGLLASIFFAILSYFLISSRSRAVEIADKMTREIQENKALDEAILFGIGDSLVVTDKNGVITLVNEAFEHTTGWKKAEVLGKKLTDAIPMLQEDGTPITAAERVINRVLQTGAKESSSVDRTYSYMRKDGSSFPIAYSATPILKDKTIIGSVEVFRDISSEKEASDKTKDRASELERLNKTMVDRELKMVELKERLAKYEKPDAGK